VEFQKHPRGGKAMWMWELVGVLDNPSVSKAKDKDPGFKARRLESGREPMGGPDHTAPAPALVVVYQHRHRHLAGTRPSLRAKGTFKAVELYGAAYTIFADSCSVLSKAFQSVSTETQISGTVLNCMI
jgi:hypothetical protein